MTTIGRKDAYLTQRYIIREHVKLSRTQKEALIRIMYNVRSEQRTSMHHNTRQSLRDLGLITIREIAPTGRQKKSRRISVLTPAGYDMAERITDEAEGVTGNGDYLFLVDALPAGMVDGQEVDWNGQPVATAEQIDAAIDAEQIEQLEEEEATQRKIVRAIEYHVEHVADTKERKAELRDTLREEIAKLNSIRAQLAILRPAGFCG